MVSVLSGFCCAQSFAHSCALWSVHVSVHVSVSGSVFIFRLGKSCRVEGLSRRSREASAAGAAQRFVNVRARQLAQKVRGRERYKRGGEVVHKGKTVAASAVRTVAFHLDSVLGFCFFFGGLGFSFGFGFEFGFVFVFVFGRQRRT